MEEIIPKSTLGEKAEIQMRIVGVYSFNRGKEIIESKFELELREIKAVIAAIDSRKHKNQSQQRKNHARQDAIQAKFAEQGIPARI
jgi:hypothetical protein